MIKASKIVIPVERNIIITCILIYCLCSASIAQIAVLNPEAENILHGNYDPAKYAPSGSIGSKDQILDLLVSSVSPDSLKSYLIELEIFGNRNARSDTLSSSRGIGAARRWIHSKFNSFSTRNDNRLIVSYLQFNTVICGLNDHRNVFAVLPGTDTSLKDIVFLEAHMDSRCENPCDTSCYAPGMDDNGSGTALVLELARVLSQFAFDRTIVFTTVTGEEQGLLGSDAWAVYFYWNNIQVLACLNNDIVGGIECGAKSSPPSCPDSGLIDSLNLRVFSYSPQDDSSLASMGKQLARYVKLQQIEELNPRLPFDMDIKLQIREDRQGRGGDHIPFRKQGFASIRFTSSYEHGDGSGTVPDRQHSVRDVLGFDLSVPPNGIIDTFLVDFNYLRRNTLTNGFNLALLANSPPIPNPLFELNNFGHTSGIRFQGRDTLFDHRIGVRRSHSGDLYFDTVLDFSQHVIDVSSIFPKGDVQLHCMNVRGEIESIPQAHHNDGYLNRKAYKKDEFQCISVFPNPNSGIVHLKWNCPVSGETFPLMIFGPKGELVREMKLLSHQLNGPVELDLSSLKTGIYELVIIANGDEVFSQSFIQN